MRSAYGIPFAYGDGADPDGSGFWMRSIRRVIGPHQRRARAGPALARTVRHARRARLPQRLLYVGTGDRGGAVPSATAANLERALDALARSRWRTAAPKRSSWRPAGRARPAAGLRRRSADSGLHGTGCLCGEGHPQALEPRGRAWHSRQRPPLWPGRWVETPPRAPDRGRLVASARAPEHERLTGTSIPRPTASP